MQDIGHHPYRFRATKNEVQLDSLWQLEMLLNFKFIAGSILSLASKVYGVINPSLAGTIFRKKCEACASIGAKTFTVKLLH